MPNKTSQIIYVCSSCGEEFSKWQGKCSNCGLWNTLKEFYQQKTKISKDLKDIDIVNLAKVTLPKTQRISVKISEFDRVLGNGIVPGSIILLGGEPGIGKSTLLMQLASSLANTFYVSGEESVAQIKMRADRLKIKAQNIILNPGAASITVSWNNPSDADLSKIRIYGSQTQGQLGSILKEVIASGDNQSTTIGSLESGKKYWITIKAVNSSDNESPDSTQYSVTTL